MNSFMVWFEDAKGRTVTGIYDNFEQLNSVIYRTGYKVIRIQNHASNK